MQFYLIAGESSGDFIGYTIIKAIKALNQQESDKKASNVSFIGIGGKMMQAEGMNSLLPMNQLSIMGFLEIIPHIFRIKRLIDQTVSDIIKHNPGILITIDAPGFTVRVAKRVKALAPHIKLIHIVAPSVWAYKPKRAKQYAQIYDHLLTLLPFEPKYFTSHGLRADWIGHPVLEQQFVQHQPKTIQAKIVPVESESIIAVTPGSRKGEITRHMPIICQSLELLASSKKIKAIFIQPDTTNQQLINSFLGKVQFDYSFTTDRLAALAISDCAIAKSGTNILEIVACGVPCIVGYKINMLSFWLLKMFIKVKFACLINIIADRLIIPEYIQNNFKSEKIAKAIHCLLDDPQQANQQVTAAKQILLKLGLNSTIKPSEKAAKIIMTYTDNI
jgi:lipid-A-disaccharide synthase